MQIIWHDRVAAVEFVRLALVEAADREDGQNVPVVIKPTVAAPSLQLCVWRHDWSEYKRS